jgi:hypothetical protein
VLDFEEIIGAIAGSNFSGPLILEYLPQFHGRLAPDALGYRRCPAAASPSNKKELPYTRRFLDTKAIESGSKTYRLHVHIASFTNQAKTHAGNRQQKRSPHTHRGLLDA